MSSERRRLIATAVPLYLLLGGFFASALATTVLQALFVGFGWTAIAVRAGLKRDQEQAKKQRESELEEIVSDVAAKDAELTELRQVSARTLREKADLAAQLDILLATRAQP